MGEILVLWEFSGYTGKSYIENYINETWGKQRKGDGQEKSILIVHLESTGFL